MSETTITVIENPRREGKPRARRTWGSKSDVKPTHRVYDGLRNTHADVIPLRGLYLRFSSGQEGDFYVAHLAPGNELSPDDIAQFARGGRTLWLQPVPGLEDNPTDGEIFGVTSSDSVAEDCFEFSEYAILRLSWDAERDGGSSTEGTERFDVYPIRA